ncbi:lysophospholipid acyltransferase family protein [Sulfurospirillum oryzae]|uniref:lysophospholipid acyltransferase family protein n=1 Tax=Sulfurospirillum oryzae TaxID=2976535 RepID=UPI0021E81912|nr:lysophospholipid acyltransferase family protein [Sulfurospirillum oryzae]
MAKLFSKELKRKLLVWIVPPLVYALIKLLFFTCKKKFYVGNNSSATPCIYALWHGEILMAAAAYTYYTKRRAIDTIVSNHFDGELVARLMQLFGGGTIRGSSSKGGASVLRSALKSLQKGRDIGITPDGPRGPRHSVADGIVVLAQMKKVPIVTINCNPTSFWKMKSWDQFCIPKPFCTLEFYFGDAFYVDDLTLEAAKALIQKRLLEHAV